MAEDEMNGEVIAGVISSVRETFESEGLDANVLEKPKLKQKESNSKGKDDDETPDDKTEVVSRAVNSPQPVAKPKKKSKKRKDKAILQVDGPADTSDDEDDDDEKDDDDEGDSEGSLSDELDPDGEKYDDGIDDEPLCSEDDNSDEEAIVCFDKPLSKLPTEVKTYILSYLSDSETFVAASVCQEWKNIVKKRLEKLTTPYVLELFLEHIYTGEIPRKRVYVVIELYLLADKYNLKTLSRACEKSLMDQMNTSNALKILVAVDKNKFSRVKDDVLKYVASKVSDKEIKDKDVHIVLKDQHRLRLEIQIQIGEILMKIQKRIVQKIKSRARLSKK